ncbi:MAG: retention module-containing protein [Pseudomonadota bacterium]
MATTIATVASLEGQAWAKSANGSLRALKVGDKVAPDETIITAAGAHIELDFGDGHPVTIAGGQEVLMGRDLWTDLATDKQDSAVQDASVQEALTVLNSGGDLTTELEETAAGVMGGSGGDGHSFVQLTRIIESTSFEAFTSGATSAADNIVLVSNELTTNRAPLLAAQSFSTDEDEAFNGQILARDIEDDALSYSVITQPTHGTFTVDAITGAFVYTPGENYNGVDTVGISATDVYGNVTTSTLSFTINSVNDAPVSADQAFSIAEDSALVGQILATDIEGDALSYSLAQGPANGLVEVNPSTGEFVYTPNANFNGSDTFSVTVADGLGGVTTHTMTVDVTAVNDVPVAAGQSLTTAEAMPIAGSLVANDVDGDSLAYSLTGVATHGVVTLNPVTGGFVYTPDAGYNGNDSFIVTIDDGKGGVATSAISVDVTPVDYAPVISTGSGSVIEDIQPLATGTLTATDIDNPALAFVATTRVGGNGSLVLSADGNWTYTLDSRANPLAAGEQSSEIFVVKLNDGSLTQIAIDVVGINDTPVASNQTLIVTEDIPLADKVIAADIDGDVLSYSLTTNTTFGTVVVDATTGNFVYTPAANFNGTDSFVVTVTDSNGSTTTSTITLNVEPVNNAPVAVDNSLVASEDTPVIYTAAQLLGNDTDIDLDTLSIASVTSGANGTAVLNPDGTVTFTPNVNFNGAADFTYTATDGRAISNAATVSVTVAPVNDAPVAVSNSLVASEDMPVIYTAAQLLGNDTDVDLDTLSIASVTSGANGTAVLNPDGTVTFNPNANFNGAADFTYTVTDGSLVSNVATVSVTVAPINDAPVAVNNSLLTNEDTPVIYTAAQLLGNDMDIELDTLSIASVTSGANGTAVLNPDGTVTFTPNANFNGAADFTYTVTDGHLVSNAATVSVTVGPVNDAPVAANNSLLASEDTPVIYTAAQLLSNDTDIDLDTLSIVSVTSGANGTAVLNPDGTVTFTPNVNFNGAADFTYRATDGNLISNAATVSVTVAPLNDAPVAVNNRLLASEDTPVIYTAAQLVGNDTDIDLDTLSIASVTSGTNGAAVLNPDGTVTFTPNTHFNGAADFTYTVTDGNLISNVATVSVTVAPLNDAPVAVSDSLLVNEDTPVIYTAAQLLGNDSDIDLDTLSIASVTSGANGTAVLNPDGTVTFTPNANFNGVADFTYIATDGSLVSSAATVSVTVAPINDAPVAVNNSLLASEDTPVIYTAAQLLGNDTDIDLDTLSIASVTSGANGTAVLNVDGTVTFTPIANFNGAADFTYTVTDGNLVSNLAVVSVTVGPVNDAPVAVNNSLSASEDTPVIYTAAQLVGNDTDIDLDTLSIASVTSGANGTAVLNPDGTVTFTPNVNFNGVADFTYTATDGNLISNAATVSVTVAPANDAPIAVNNNLSASEDIQVIYTAAQLLGNDTDIDLDTLSIASVTSGANGIAVLNLDGTVTFTANANFNGAADFTYRVTDGSLVSNAATVNVAVAAVNDAPVAVNNNLSTNEDTPMIFTAAQLLGNDTDIELDALSLASVTSGANGTAVLNANGDVVFTPNANFSGAADFTYIATDGALVSNSATVNVMVNPVADIPVLNISVEENSGVISIPMTVPPSVGLTSEHFVGIPTVASANAHNLATVEAAVEAATATSTSTITDVAYPSISADDAYHIQGYIFLEAGHTYQLAGSRDDTLLVKIGGTTVYSVGFNTWGDLHNGLDENGAFPIAPTPLPVVKSGYYSFEVIIYNGDHGGNLNLDLSVDGQPALDINTTNFNLYTDIATVNSAGALVSNGDGGFHPLLNIETQYNYFSLNVSAALADTDGSESLTVNASGIPIGTTLTDGANMFVAAAGLTSTDVTDWNLAGLTVIPATGQTTSFDLTFTATATDGASSSAITKFEMLDPADNEATNNVGTVGIDNLIGVSGADAMFGLNGDDTINGNGGGDLFVGGAGNDNMTSSGVGADTFKWDFGDQGTVITPANDVLINFDMFQGDSLNLSDLLQNETAANLTQYLHFEISGADTTVSVSSAGAFDGTNYAIATDQTIVLSNLNLTGTDTAIIDQLKNNGNLITD